MIQLLHDELIFSFPELEARLQERVREWTDAKVSLATAKERARLPAAQSG